MSMLLNQCLITRMTSSANYYPPPPPLLTHILLLLSPVDAFCGVLPVQVTQTMTSYLRLRCHLKLCYISVFFYPVNYYNHLVPLEDTFRSLFVFVQIKSACLSCDNLIAPSLTGCLLEFVFTEKCFKVLVLTLKEHF